MVCGRLVKFTVGGLMLLLSGCSQNPTPVPVPPPPSVVAKVGINDGFHGPVPADVVEHMCRWGKDLTVRSPVLNVVQVYQILTSTFRCSSLHNMILIESNDLNLVATIADALVQNNVRAVELCNECELSPLNLTPQQYINFVVTGHDILRKAGYKGDIISGGVYTVDNEMVTQRLIPLHKRCPDCVLGVHWYGNKDAATRKLLTDIGARLAVTECGKPSRTPAEDQLQFQEVSDCLNAGRWVSADYIIIYQRPSGPSQTDFDNFGLERFDGSWKPAEVLLKN